MTSPSRPSRAPASPLESLESRLLFHLEVVSALPDISLNPGAASAAIDLNHFFDNEDPAVPGPTFTATSDQPNRLTPVVSGNTLTVQTGPDGLAGTANVTVRATEAGGAFVEDTFAVAVGVLDVRIGDGDGAAAKSVTFTDADGTRATISLKGGTATVRFTGSDLTQSAARRSLAVAGTGVQSTLVDITGAAGRSTALTFKARGGNGRIDVGRVTSDGPVKSISGKPIVLGATRQIFGTANPTTSAINGHAGRIDLAAADISGSGLRTASIGKLSVAGNFQANLTFDPPATAGQPHTILGSVTIKGILDGVWMDVGAGDIGKVSAGTVRSGWLGALGGDVASFTTKGNFDGRFLGVRSIRSMSVGGDMTGDISAVSNLGKLTVKGAVNGVEVIASDAIGSITAGTVAGSRFHAGVIGQAGNPLPDEASDFTTSPDSDSAIGSVTVKGKGPGAFVDTNIAARRIGKLTLGNLQLANGGMPFGVAADRITSVRITVDGDKTTLKDLDDPADAATRVAALGVDLQDFRLRVL